MDKIEYEMYKSLELKYKAEIQECKTTLLIYFKNSVGIGEHPQQLEEMDKLLDKIASSQDKLDQLIKHFKDFSEPQQSTS